MGVNMGKATARRRNSSVQPVIANENAKLPHETHAQHKERIAVLKMVERRPGEPILPPEARQHAEYADEMVQHVDPHNNTVTLTQAPREITATGIVRMYENGQINADQLQAAVSIQATWERMTRKVRAAKFEPRMDCSGSATDQLVESIQSVRMERAYIEWQRGLGVRAALLIDMLTSRHGMYRVTREYRKNYYWAREQLFKALDQWTQDYETVCRNVDEQDVERIYHRIGEGRLR